MFVGLCLLVCLYQLMLIDWASCVGGSWSSLCVLTIVGKFIFM